MYPFFTRKISEAWRGDTTDDLVSVSCVQLSRISERHAQAIQAREFIPSIGLVRGARVSISSLCPQGIALIRAVSTLGFSVRLSRCSVDMHSCKVFLLTFIRAIGNLTATVTRVPDGSGQP